MKSFWLVSFVACLFANHTRALILTGTGNTPVTGRNWPTSSVDVADLTNRIGWWEGPPFGGGEWHFNYVGDMEALRRTLDLFAKIKAPALDLHVHDGGKPSFAGDANSKIRTNEVLWSFMVWDAESWARLYGARRALFFDDPNARKITRRKIVDEAGNGVAGINLFAANTFLPDDSPYRPLTKSDATTDSAGRFVLNNLPPGRVQIWLRSTHYFTTNIFDYHAVPGPEITMVVKTTGMLRVPVREETGQPADGQSISVAPTEGAGRGKWSASARLGPDGAYFFNGVHPGSYLVSVNNTASQATAIVLPNQTAEVTIQLPAKR